MSIESFYANVSGSVVVFLKLEQYGHTAMHLKDAGIIPNSADSNRAN